MDFSGAAESVVYALGETYVYFDGVDTVEITAVPSSGWQRVEGARGRPVRSNRQEIMVLKSEVAEPAAGHKLFRGTLEDFTGQFEFEIVDFRLDNEATSYTLILKATA